MTGSSTQAINTVGPAMTSIESVILEVSDPVVADAFYSAAFGLGDQVCLLHAQDGTIWKVATSSKKDTGPATRQIDEIVLLLGAADVPASKRFYLDRGLEVARSFGRKYVEFATPSSPVKLALCGRNALAKDAGRLPRRHRIAPDRHRQRCRSLHRPGRVRVGGCVSNRWSTTARRGFQTEVSVRRFL